MSGTYDQPDAVGGGRIKFSEHVGALVLIQPQEVTKFTFDDKDGPQDVIKSTVDVIEGQGSPRHEEGVLVSNFLLFDALKGKVGRRVLGRLEKAGRAIKLSPYVDGDPAKADAYLAKLDKDADVESPGAPVPANPVEGVDLSGLNETQLAAIQAVLASKGK